MEIKDEKHLIHFLVNAGLFVVAVVVVVVFGSRVSWMH